MVFELHPKITKILLLKLQEKPMTNVQPPPPKKKNAARYVLRSRHASKNGVSILKLIYLTSMNADKNAKICEDYAKLEYTIVAMGNVINAYHHYRLCLSCFGP